MDTNDKTRDTSRVSAQGSAKAAPAGKSGSGAPRRASAGTMSEPWKKPVRPDAARRKHEEAVKRQAPSEGRTADRAQQAKRPQQPRQSQPGAPRQGGQRRPEAAGQRPAPQRPVQGENAQRSAAPDEVFHPVEDRTVQPGQNAPVRRPRQDSRPAKKRTASDSGYQPYRAANQRKKAEKRNSVKQFFSKQNPILRTYARLTDKGDTFAEDSEIARKRNAQREAAAAKKRKKQSAFTAPAVIYTQPQAFSRDRLLVQLLTVVAVVLALVLGLSVFFKVKTITITGAEVYSPWAVREASGIKEGDNLLTFGRARASGQITANLPYVKSVRIGIKLPDTVNIEIDEENVVYAIKSEEGIWWLMNSDGKVVDMANSSIAKNYTQVLGVTLTAPQKNVIGIATEDIPTETDADGEYIPLTVTGAQRLYAALQILKALEDNDIVGEAASVDVSRMEDIILWYGSRYQVNLGDTSRMDYKIACMCDVILQMSDYQTGILDISFTTWSDQVGYTPFE